MQSVAITYCCNKQVEYLRMFASERMIANNWRYSWANSAVQAWASALPYTMPVKLFARA